MTPFFRSRMMQLVALSALMFSGCSKPANFLYFHPSARDYSITQKIKEVTGSNSLDIFWTIGGMTEQEQNFSTGVGIFMTNFITKPYSWRMAVVSSNTFETPYLGMPQIFDNNSPNGISTLVNAVDNATQGMDNEMIFDPVVHYLSMYPAFVRPGGTLVLILTNDAHDSSRGTTTAAQMVQFLKGIKGGDLSKVIVYGIFGATDLNCNIGTIDEDWNYHGSEFEALVNATGGQTYSLCDATFGTQLAKLGDNLYQRLDNPRIVLSTRPDPETIHVFFHDAELPGGPQKSGGLWYYDVNSNAVVFYNLDFAKLDTEEVTVRFTEDSGVK